MKTAMALIVLIGLANGKSVTSNEDSQEIKRLARIETQIAELMELLEEKETGKEFVPGIWVTKTTKEKTDKLSNVIGVIKIFKAAFDGLIAVYVKFTLLDCY